ncbi:FHA domain-containing protein [Lautropia mirabilis]|uniref:FHA domain-containing protein n=2 Tax=Lautropia mirabilis TaxID=47671 RepID=UPI0028DD1792|nr:FHA domain-containing protein [Lautropia mirabilis]
MGTDHQDGEMQPQGNRYGQLSLSAAGQPLRTYWLTQTRTVIGRRATNTLVLDDLTVSGEHAVLLAGQQDVVIQDLGSRNGTLVNGAPVARALLNDGDCIDIGIYRLVYRRAGVVSPTDALEQGAPSGDAQHPDASGHDASSRDAPASDAFPPLSMGDTIFLLDRLAPDFPLFQTPGTPSPSTSLPPVDPSSLPPSATPDSRRGGTSSLSGTPSEPPRVSGRLPPLPGGSQQPASQQPASQQPGIFSSPLPPAPEEGGQAGFIEGFNRAPRLPPTPMQGQAAWPPAMLPHAPPPMPRARPALDRPADFQGVSLRFLGGHDAGRLLIIDRPIVSIRNGCGQVAVVTNRNGNFFLTHVEGSAYPMVNGESIGLGAHPLRNHDLIELSGTIIQFSQSPAGSQPPSGPPR